MYCGAIANVGDRVGELSPFRYVRKYVSIVNTISIGSTAKVLFIISLSRYLHNMYNLRTYVLLYSSTYSHTPAKIVLVPAIPTVLYLLAIRYDTYLRIMYV